jgi:hypothetical protein
MNRVSFRELRRYQLSLILIGIAIARQGDRKRLFEQLSLGSVTSERARGCLQSVLDGDVSGVRRFLLSLGVDAEGGTSLDAIVSRLHESVAEEEVEGALRAVLGGTLGDWTGSTEDRLELALRTVRSVKGSRFKQRGSSDGKAV